MVMFCSGLPAKRREEDRALHSQFLLETSGRFINYNILILNFISFLSSLSSLVELMLFFDGRISIMGEMKEAALLFENITIVLKSFSCLWCGHIASKAKLYFN